MSMIDMCYSYVTIELIRLKLKKYLLIGRFIILDRILKSMIIRCVKIIMTIDFSDKLFCLRSHYRKL